ncbi:hypothetical protein [Crateriforma spongiae]|uniref:hypothetical protein n=1 Tax=Crateriforma spongiae TaxID=2724528 RepID=UPI0014462ED1|nr:hypothetical protein [Crateriforma spongiae]
MDEATSPGRKGFVASSTTVGGRSYLFARKLVAKGIDAVNYHASILGWCHAGLPLETPDGESTNAVHPYWRIFRVPDQYDVKLMAMNKQENRPHG